MEFTSRRGIAQLAALGLAAAAAVAVAAASVGARGFATRVLARVTGWHLARGLAVEMARARKNDHVMLNIESVAELYFVGRLIERYPASARKLAPYSVRVVLEAGTVDARVGWKEGSLQRTERESARRVER
ncbi:MAG: hypothetical protein HYY25_03570 [Candidatus Wallbacteria bacterium]|nr:hypothetical protein [Candidatus Wallbacteria bacterium]